MTPSEESDGKRLAANDGDGSEYQWDGGPDNGSLDGPTYDNRATSTKGGDVDSSYWSDYIGTGTFEISYASNQSQSWDGSGGNATSSSPMDAQGWVRIDYEYQPVPEPTSLALLALGGAVVALRRRRRTEANK